MALFRVAQKVLNSAISSATVPCMLFSMTSQLHWLNADILGVKPC